LRRPGASSREFNKVAWLGTERQARQFVPFAQFGILRDSAPGKGSLFAVRLDAA
jgi:hypothetical protein